MKKEPDVSMKCKHNSFLLASDFLHRKKNRKNMATKHEWIFSMMRETPSHLLAVPSVMILLHFVATFVIKRSGMWNSPPDRLVWLTIDASCLIGWSTLLWQIMPWGRISDSTIANIVAHPELAREVVPSINLLLVFYLCMYVYQTLTSWTQCSIRNAAFWIRKTVSVMLIVAGIIAFPKSPGKMLLLASWLLLFTFTGCVFDLIMIYQENFILPLKPDERFLHRWIHAVLLCIAIVSPLLFPTCDATVVLIKNLIASYGINEKAVILLNITVSEIPKIAGVFVVLLFALVGSFEELSQKQKIE